jgi:hypothetical protein
MVIISTTCITSYESKFVAEDQGRVLAFLIRILELSASNLDPEGFVGFLGFPRHLQTYADSVP